MNVKSRCNGCCQILLQDPIERIYRGLGAPGWCPLGKKISADGFQMFQTPNKPWVAVDHLPSKIASESTSNDKVTIMRNAKVLIRVFWLEKIASNDC